MKPDTEILTNLRTNAQRVWESGVPYYNVCLTAFGMINDNLESLGTDSSEAGFNVLHMTAWDSSLAVIEKIGWRLHTWTPVQQQTSSSISSISAYALFSRLAETKESPALNSEE